MMATKTLPRRDPPELATSLQLAGAAAFDATLQRIGAISSAAYDRDESEDFPGMVAALQEAIQFAIGQGPDYLYGFLMPIADLMDCHRMGLANSDEWTGTRLVQQSMQVQSEVGHAQ